jgi:hypothetical protein
LTIAAPAFDVVLGTNAHVRCEGKGKTQRGLPLTTAPQAGLSAS